MNNDLIYAYCILNKPPRFQRSMEYAGLKCLKSGIFFVIVKNVSRSEFSEENFRKNLSDNTWVEYNARDHIRFINMIMEYNTLIPFKFGTVYHSEESLKKFIEEYSSSLIENLHRIEGKEEWAVKMYCDCKALSQQIDGLSDAAFISEKQISASSPGKAFFFKRKKTELIEQEIDRLRKNYGQEYYDEFKNLSESSRLNNLLPKEHTGRKDEMILNATLLVGKNNIKDLISTFGLLKEKYKNLGFDIEATGPWPPFSFISIKEK